MVKGDKLLERMREVDIIFVENRTNDMSFDLKNTKFSKVTKVPKCSSKCQHNDPHRQVAIVKSEEAEGGYVIMIECPSIGINGCRAIIEWRCKTEPPTYEKLINNI